MEDFSLDMAFAPAEVAAGLEELFAARGYAWTFNDDGSTRRYHVACPAVIIEVGPLPDAQRQPTPFATRTLLRATSAGAPPAELTALRQGIVLAFLRVMG
jgi:hypothetical protein